MIEANAVPDGSFVFLQRLDFTIERNALKHIVEELKEDNLTLELVVRGIRTVKDFESERPSEDSSKLASSLQKVQNSAKPLFGAVHSGYQDKCHPKHQVLLSLNARIENVRHTGTNRMVTSNPKDSVLFELAFAAQKPDDDNSITWCAAVVQASGKVDSFDHTKM